MKLDIKEMSIRTGIPEARLATILGVQAYVNSFDVAYAVYKEAVNCNGDSDLGRQVEFDLLYSHADTFDRALRGYKVTPPHSNDRDAMLRLTLSLVTNQNEAGELCKATPTASADEAYTVRKIAHFF